MSWRAHLQKIWDAHHPLPYNCFSSSSSLIANTTSSSIISTSNTSTIGTLPTSLANKFANDNQLFYNNMESNIIEKNKMKYVENKNAIFENRIKEF